MKFGTFYFFQPTPGQRHADIIRGELDQIEWTEELGFDEIWLTEHHFIEYGLSVAFQKFVVPDRIEDAHPSLQPGFRAMVERPSKVTREGLGRRAAVERRTAIGVEGGAFRGSWKMLSRAGG